MAQTTCFRNHLCLLRSDQLLYAHVQSLANHVSAFTEIVGYLLSWVSRYTIFIAVFPAIEGTSGDTFFFQHTAGSRDSTVKPCDIKFHLARTSTLLITKLEIQCVYKKTKICDIDDPHKRLIETWCEFEQDD